MAKIQIRNAQIQNLEYVKALPPKESPEVCYEMLSKACGHKMVCVNELCEKHVIDARSALKKYKWYRQRVKQLANAAVLAMRDTTMKAKCAVKQDNRDLYFSYVDSWNEKIEPHINNLYWVIRQEFTKGGYCPDDADILTRLEVCRVLLQTSCNMFDNIVDDSTRDCRVNFRLIFLDYAPLGALHFINELEDIVNKMYDKKGFANVDLNSPNVTLAYEIIHNKFANGDFLDESAKDALEENMDMFSDEERLEIDEIVRRLEDKVN